MKYTMMFVLTVLLSQSAMAGRNYIKNCESESDKISMNFNMMGEVTQLYVGKDFYGENESEAKQMTREEVISEEKAADGCYIHLKSRATFKISAKSNSSVSSFEKSFVCDEYMGGPVLGCSN